MGLTISFIILFSLLLWLTIGLKGNWLFKAVVILVALLFSVSTLSSIENFYGWPTVQPMPKDFRIYWALAKEPNISRKEDGALYYWIEDLTVYAEGEVQSGGGLITFENHRMSGVRAYRAPYSVDAHTELINIVERIIGGGVVIGSSSGANLPEEFLISNGDVDSENGDINFYSLPPSGRPNKGSQ